MGDKNKIPIIVGSNTLNIKGGLNFPSSLAPTPVENGLKAKSLAILQQTLHHLCHHNGVISKDRMYISASRTHPSHNLLNERCSLWGQGTNHDVRVEFTYMFSINYLHFDSNFGWQISLLAPIRLPKWVWPSMNQYDIFSVQTCTVTPKMHQDLLNMKSIVCKKPTPNQKSPWIKG